MMELWPQKMMKKHNEFDVRRNMSKRFRIKTFFHRKSKQAPLIEATFITSRLLFGCIETGLQFSRMGSRI
jgi:hypothetical protein